MVAALCVRIRNFLFGQKIPTTKNHPTFIVVSGDNDLWKEAALEGDTHVYASPSLITRWAPHCPVPHRSRGHHLSASPPAKHSPFPRDTAINVRKLHLKRSHQQQHLTSRFKPEKQRGKRNLQVKLENRFSDPGNHFPRQ
jgi:hypothetical protein